METTQSNQPGAENLQKSTENSQRFTENLQKIASYLSNQASKIGHRLLIISLLAILAPPALILILMVYSVLVLYVLFSAAFNDW